MNTNLPFVFNAIDAQYNDVAGIPSDANVGGTVILAVNDIVRPVQGRAGVIVNPPINAGGRDWLSFASNMGAITMSQFTRNGNGIEFPLDCRTHQQRFAYLRSMIDLGVQFRVVAVREAPGLAGARRTQYVWAVILPPQVAKTEEAPVEEAPVEEAPVKKKSKKVEE